MTIQKLQFPEPFFTIKAIHEEERYPIEEDSIVVNLSEKDLQIKTCPSGF